MSFKGIITTLAAVCIGCLCVTAAYVERVANAVFDAVMSVAAAPARILPSFGGFAFGNPAMAYDGPTIDLRHEAGTSRRSAARNI